MLIEQQQRPERVRFRHPIRVVTVNDQPRVIRTLTGNLSREGLFLRMPEPLPMGTKVGLSLEAGGRALAFAQAEVMWQEYDDFAMPDVGRGCGVRFTQFMHPRAGELVEFLVDNLDRGRPLTLPKHTPLWARVRVPAVTAMAALFIGILGIPLLSQVFAPERGEGTPSALSEPVEDSPVAAALSEPVEDSPVPAPQKAADAAPPVLSEPVEDSPVPVVAERPEAVAAPEPAPATAASPLTPTLSPLGRGEGARVKAPASPLTPTLSPLAQGEGARAKSKARKAAPESGTVKLPTAAAPGLAWTLTGSELRLAPELGGQARVTRAFVLEGPPRVVFDVSGAQPKKSLTVNASPPYASSVRLGKQAGGTRIVVDLDSAPRRSRKDDGALVLSF